MARAWMPFYVADYLADTRHLGALEHGAYLLLLMHYWQTGGLPDDDGRLARIACTTPSEWRKIRSALADFFEPGWKHGRVERELLKSREIGDKRRAAAESKHYGSNANAYANAEQKHTQSQSPPQSLKNLSLVEGGGRGDERLPPPHLAFSRAKGRLYVHEGTPEWEAYAEDYRQVHGVYPTPNKNGGRWFDHLGAKKIGNCST